MRADLHAALMAFVATPKAEDFDALAAAVVRHQMTTIAPYGRLVAARGGFTGDWRQAPLVPTDLFRDLDLCAAGPEVPVQATFRTSGTTTGRRGLRRAPDLSLYHAGMRAPFVDHVLAGDAVPRPWLALVPAPIDDPESSLSHMVGGLAETLAASVRWAMTPDGLDVDAATEFAREVEGPAVVLTTAFALIHWLHALQGARHPLPEGSRMMLTGGYKGRARSVAPRELLEMAADQLGLAPEAVVGEYGMTELTSQAYGTPFAGPPWLQIRVVDPATGLDVPQGETGLVAFFDLLNLDNVSALLTGDQGQLDDQGRLTLLGRAPGAVLRGCSLTAEALGLLKRS